MAPAAASRGATTPQRLSMDADPVKVAAFIKERVQQDVKQNTARRPRDRADLQALMFYRGGEDNQWTVWDSASNSYVPRPTGSNDDAALPEWFFKATTNLFAVKTDGICSILDQSQPAQEIAPERDQDSDRAAAEVAEAALPVLYAEAGYEAIRPQINKLVALTNAVAVHVYYDTDERHGSDELPLIQCQNPDCRQYFLPDEVAEADPCPECGAVSGPPDQTTGQPTPATDMAMHPQTGLPVTTQAPRGKIGLRLLTSFEFSVPRSARELHEQRVSWIAGHGRMDPSEIMGLYPKAKGFLDERSAATGKTANSQSTAYADRMRALSSPGGSADQIGSGSNVAPSGPVVWFVWSDPVDDADYYFPDGLYAVMLESEVVLEQGPLPLKDDKGRPVKNVLLRTFQTTPGAAWGKPPADDLVPLQKQLNLVQALAFLILMNDAAPTTFLPDTVTLLQDLTGMPGSTVPFKSIRPGDKPIVNNGTGFPESLKWFIEYLVNQFDVVSKLNAVLMGARPQGDPTLGEIQILQERGLAAFKEPLDQLVDFEKRLSLILLWTARQSMWSPRFYSVAGENGEWDVKQFLGSDLEGSYAIHVEPASAWPQSQLLTNLRLNQAITSGILNPQDPEVQAQYLSMNDLAGFKKSLDDDRKQIARELDGWKRATDPAQIQPPDPLWNLPVHFFQKVNWLKTEDAELLAAQRSDLYQAIRGQIQGIQQLMQPPAPPAAAPGTPGGPPPDGHALSAAVAAGALKPAPPGGAPPDGRVLNAALHSGALHPAPPPGRPTGLPAAGGAAGPNLHDLCAQRQTRRPPPAPAGAPGPGPVGAP